MGWEMGNHRDQGGKCRNNFHSRRKIGGKWEEHGKWDEMPNFGSPISPIFPEVEDLPHSSLGKNPQPYAKKFGGFSTLGLERRLINLN